MCAIRPRLRTILALASVLCLLPSGVYAGSKRPVIYEPVASANTQSYFGNGEPFAVVTADSSVLMLVVDPAKIGGYKYFRVWLLYYSAAAEPVFLDPGKMVRLISTKIDKNKTEELAPEAPTEILKQISSEAASKEILQVIGGVMAGAGQAMAVQNTTYTGGGKMSGSSWTVNDRGEKERALLDANAQRTAASLERTQTAYELYSKSVNAGILRRNTVFPGSSVNGYIYFPATRSYNARSEEYRHVVALSLPHGDVEVEFNPAPGE